MRFRALLALCTLAAVAVSSAHDIWVETSQTILRPGDSLRLSLMLGNHGNKHRDFRLWGKLLPSDTSMVVVDPRGRLTDLKSRLIDTGSTPSEGFWIARYRPQAPGVHIVASTFDKVMSYGPVRNVKSAKALFVVEDAGNQRPNVRGHDRVLGHPIEIVPLVEPSGGRKGQPRLQVRVLFRGKPLSGAKVSFIPRGRELQGDADPTYERTTDTKGVASLVLAEPTEYLISANHTTQESGVGYTSIHYSATLFVVVPE